MGSEGVGLRRVWDLAMVAVLEMLYSKVRTKHRMRLQCKGPMGKE